MKEVLLSAANLPFTVALAVLGGLALLEILSWVVGFALSHTLDAALNIDLDHGINIDHGIDIDHGVDLDHGAHIDHGADVHGEAPMAIQILGWLHVGAVPVLILFMIFLAMFGISGIAIQELTGRSLNVWIAAMPAFAIGLIGMRSLGGFARKHVFREDTSAVSHDSMIGLPAIITLGATRKGTPSQAKLKDKFGQTHYVLVEPLREEDVF